MAVSIADLAIRVDATQLRVAQLEADRLASSGRNLESSANRASGAWKSFGGVLASIGLGLGVRQLIDYMDTWANIEGRLKLVTHSTQELIDIQAKLFDTANNTRSSLEGTVDLYSKLARAQKELGMTSAELIKITETVGKSMIISGAGTAQASAAILQLGQAFASGILAGDEYRSVAENSPRLIRAIAEGWENANGTIGVSIGKLRQLSRDQQLDIERVTKAIARATQNIDSEFAKMPITIGQAFTVVNNELLKFIGAGGQTSGVANALADAVIVLARNIDLITGTLLIGAAAWAAYKIALIGVSTVGFITGVLNSITALSGYDQALAANRVFIAQNSIAVANAARVEAMRTVNIGAAIAAQHALAAAQLELIAAQAAQTASLTLSARAFAFLGSILPAIKAELSAIGIIAAANPYALLITGIVVATGALYLFRDAAIGDTENSAVKEYSANVDRAKAALDANLITVEQYNVEVSKQIELMGDTNDAIVQLGDYFTAVWTLISAGWNRVVDDFNIGINDLKQNFKWFDELASSITAIKEKFNNWQTPIGKLADDIARARKATEDYQKAQDNITRGTAEITEQGLKFTKNQEDLYVKLSEQSQKLTVSEHDRMLKEINDSRVVGKEREAMLALLAKIDEAKAKGLKNGEVEKSQIKEVQDLAKASIDAQIYDITRLTDAKLQSYGLESDILKNQYDDNLITAQQYRDAKISLINAERDATINALTETQGKYQESFKAQLTDATELQRATLALMKVESGGNQFAISTTKDGRHAIGSMQTLPSTLKGYGVDMGGLTNTSSEEDLLGWLKTANNAFIAESTGIKMYAELVEKLGGNFANAASAYNEGEANFKTYGITAGENAKHVRKFQEEFANGSKDAIDLTTRIKDAEAARYSEGINAQKETIAVNHELKKAIEEYSNAVASAQIKYLEMTGQTAQAAIESDKLAKATDNVRKQAILLGDKDALKFIDAIRTINPDLKPLLDKIKYYGMLEQEVSRATAAEYEEAAATNTDPAQIAFLKAKAQGFRDVADAQQLLNLRAMQENIGATLTDDATNTYIDNLKRLREAQLAGMSPDLVDEFAAKIKQEFDQNSPAGKQAHNFFETLKETSSQGFMAMLQNGASASEAMTTMFKNMADNITASFLKLGQNSLFDWIENGTMKAGGWMNVAVAGLSVGAQLLANVLSADQPTRTPSTAESYQSNELGASKMALIDSLSRDTGYSFATKAATLFNNNLQTFSNSIQNNALRIADGLLSIGDKIAKTQAFQTVSNWLGSIGDGIGKVTSLLSEGWGIVNKFFTSTTNSIASFLGFTEKASAAVAEGGLSGAGQAVSKVVGQALAVVGAVYSIYTFATGIGDLIDSGTVGQVVGSVMQLASSLLAFAGAFVSIGPVGWIIAGVLAVVGFLISFFDEVRKPLIMMTSLGNDLRKFDGIQKIQFPSGRGAIVTDSAFGTIELRSKYQGGLNAEQLNNAAGPLLLLMAATDDAMAAAFDKIDKQKETSNYIRANLNQYIEQNLESADVSKMIEQRYEAIINLAEQSGTYAGIAFNKIFDILISKFKAFDQNTLAAMGIAASIAGNLQAFIDTVPLSFWDLVNKRIEGVGGNKTAEQFTAELNKGILGFVALKSVLNTISAISDDAVVAIMDSKGSIDTVALNMAQFVISLKSIAPNISMAQVIDQINKIKAATTDFSDQYATAFFGAFSSFSAIVKDLSFTSLDDLTNKLSYYSNQMLGAAEVSAQAANAAIDYAIAENHLAGVSRESAIQTLLRTKAIDEATVAEADYSIAVQSALKSQLDAMGFIQSFVVAAGKTLRDFSIGADDWFNAGKNVIAVFGDMSAAANFYTKLTGAFLNDNEQKTAAQKIAANNAKNLLDAANDAGLGAKLGLGELTAENTSAWITTLLQTGQGIDGIINSFASVSDGTLFKNLFNALADLKTTTDALADATDKLTAANKAALAITLEEWLQKNKLGSTSALNDVSKNAEFRQQIISSYTSASQGNAAAAGSLTGLIDEYLTFAQKFDPANFKSLSDWATGLVSSLKNTLQPATINNDVETYTNKKAQRIDVNVIQNKNDNADQIALLIKAVQVAQEGHKQTIKELRKTNTELAALKASARRREVKA